MDAGKYNLRNPAVKRIMQEMREIQKESSGEIMAEALEDNIFEWHFAIRGPPDTEFEGGIYQGRIVLPPEYPFKPPSFIMISPSGRFETGVKICLSMSSHHPEHWQPSWSVRVALVALIAFLPTSGHGAIGSLDFTKDERRVLAQQSRQAPPKYGSDTKQRIINSLHVRMLAAEQVTDEASSSRSQPEDASEQPTLAPTPRQAAGSGAHATLSPTSSAAQPLDGVKQCTSAAVTPEGQQQPQAAQSTESSPQQCMPSEGIPILRRRMAVQSENSQTPENAPAASDAHQAAGPHQPQQATTRSGSDWEDLGLTVAAVFLSVIIIVILLRKLFLTSSNGSDVSMDVDLASFE